MADVTLPPSPYDVPNPFTAAAAPALRRLAAQLRPHRRRELAVLALIALTAAFAAGHQTATLALRPDIAALAGERAALQAEVARLAAIAERDATVSLLLRHWQARRAYFELASAANRDTLHASRDAVAAHIAALLRRGAASRGAGPGDTVLLTLAADGSVWPLPPELAR
jgi:cell division protein FtsB